MVTLAAHLSWGEALNIARGHLIDFDYDDSVWRMAPRTEGNVLQSDRTISFDTIIAPSERLTSGNLGRELSFSKRLVVFNIAASSLAPSPSFYVYLNDYWQFLRWRIFNGIDSNEDMGAPEFDKLFADLKAKGILGLVPGSDRLEGLTARIKQDFSVLSPLCANNMLSMRRVHEHCGVPSSRFFSRHIFEDFLRALSDAQIQTRSKSLGHATDDFKVGQGRVFQFLLMIEWIHRFSAQAGAGGLHYSPFGRRLSAARIASRIGVSRGGRTKTIPIEQASKLMHAAARWVLLVAPHLDAGIARLIACGEVAPQQGQERLVVRKQQADTLALIRKEWLCSDIDELRLLATRMSFRYVSAFSKGTHEDNQIFIADMYYKYLSSACIIIISAFSARRTVELRSLKAGCILKEDSLHWLDVWIAKTIKRREFVPVPEIVATAVSVLDRISASQRHYSGKEWLCVFHDDVSNVAGRGSFQLKINESIQAFAELTAAPDRGGGQKWRFANHQFRRLFAILYFYRFRNANLTALSVFLKHFDVSMTRRYITEATSGSFLDMADEMSKRESAEVLAVKRQRMKDFWSVGQELREETFSSIARGEIIVGGHGGELISDALESLISELRVQLNLLPDEDVPEASFNSVIRAFAKSTLLEPNGLGHSYCKCGTSARDTALARCVDKASTDTSEGRGPNPQHAADLVCAGCSHNVQLPENRLYWEKAILREKALLCGPLAPLLAAAAVRRLSGLEELYNRCYATRSNGDET